MWLSIGDWIIRYRNALFALILILTAGLTYLGVTRVELTQEFIKVIPPDDPDFQHYTAFKKVFGEDGNVLIVAMRSENWFTPQTLNQLQQLTTDLRALKGVQNALNLSNLSILTTDTVAQKLNFTPIFTKPLTTQAEADTIRKIVLSQPFYRSLLINAKGDISVLAVTLTDSALRTKQKHITVNLINEKVAAFAKANQIETHSGGMPYLRAYITKKLPVELLLFTGLSLLLTGLSLYMFYRSVYAMVFPLILLAICGLWTFGIVGLLGYKLTVLTGLLPPIVIILGIPPSVYMISDYHEEYKRTGNKIEAIRQMIRRLGLVTMMINANTAFGFLTLYFTNVVVLQEFGLIAFLGTSAAYFLTIVLIPGVLSIMPPPTDKHLKHLDAPSIRNFVTVVNRAIASRRTWIYTLTFGLLVLSGVGITRLQAVSYMVDDLPTHDGVYADLKFIEQHFKGSMPFEVVLKAPKPGGFKNASFLKRNLKKIDQLQRKLESYPEISRTVSIVDGMKWSRQALFGDSSAYVLPTEDELEFILLYAQNNKNSPKSQDKNSPGVLSSVIDSTYTYARITGFMQDVGSVVMPDLMARAQADVDAIFPPDAPQAKKVETYVTGLTRIFLKANEYLIDNLKWSLIAVFIIIGLQMLALFGSFRIMVISMIPNIIPLVVTAGIMGFFAIPLKPSTALIYELAFGIAIDNSIHYLASYRHERRSGKSVAQAVADSMDSTGVGIVYTSIVLFAGFGVFAASAFGSTRSLGVLTSVTLFVALFSNLFLMPALLLNFDREKATFRPALIDEDKEEEYVVPS